MKCLRLQFPFSCSCLLLVASAVLVEGEDISSRTCAGCPRVIVENVSLHENQTTYVHCSASGLSIQNIAWKRQGKPIRNKTDASYDDTGLKDPSYFTFNESRDEGLKSTLMLWNSQRAMAGQYSCEASNNNGTTKKQFQIQARPIIVPDFHEDKSKTYKEGSLLELSCIAQSYPEPTIEWRLGDKALISLHECKHIIHPNETRTVENYPNCEEGCPVAHCSIYSVEKSSKYWHNSSITIVSVKSRLVIRKPSTSDRGTYECIATASNTTLSARNSTLIRVHSKLGPLWPSLGIISEVIILVIIIFLSEKYDKVKKRRKTEDPNTSTQNSSSRDSRSPVILSGLNSSNQPQQRKQHSSVRPTLSSDSHTGLVTTSEQSAIS